LVRNDYQHHLFDSFVGKHKKCKLTLFVFSALTTWHVYNQQNVGRVSQSNCVHDNLMFTRFIDERFTYSPLPFLTLGLRWCVVGADINGSAQWRSQILLLSTATSVY